GHAGVASESGTIRVGSTQTAAYLAGVFGATAASGTAVYVSSSGKLGTTLSSRRYKRDVADVSATADVLLRLRPVAFRYTEERDPSGEQQYGLIAEEVADVAPELVVAGADGQPETVKYNLVDALLLELVKRQEARIQELEAAVRALQEPRTGPAR
ncbi:tail fiber domain-containing protein, partial [Acidobacteria bacterium ACD]|nr:tail fiber domain-containing protein [Acidobacteria bacterium ACD]